MPFKFREASNVGGDHGNQVSSLPADVDDDCKCKEEMDAVPAKLTVSKVIDKKIKELLVAPYDEKNVELRGSERLLFFTDAVVAIAGTLLILPLMEAATELQVADEEISTTVKEFFHEHRGQFGAFILSFYLVGDEFWPHHTFLFVHVHFTTRILLMLNMLWLFVLMFLPVAASLFITESQKSVDNTSATIFYFGIIATLILIYTVATIYIKYHPTIVLGEQVTNYSILKCLVSLGFGILTIGVGTVLSQTKPAFNWCAVFVFPLKHPTMYTLQTYLQWERNQSDRAHYYYARTNFVMETCKYCFRKVTNVFAKTNDMDTKAVEEAAQTKQLMELNKDIFHHISERLIIFTDAVVAISMTLLILPLMESSAELREGGGITATEYFKESKELIGSLTLSFCIIALRWKKHDNLYLYIEGAIPANFMIFTTPWLLSIAFLPVASVLFVLNDEDEADGRGQAAVYMGNILFNQVVLCVMTFIVYTERKDTFPPSQVLSSVIAVAVNIAVLGLAMIFPEVSKYLTILLFGSTPVTWVLRRVFPTLERSVLMLV